MPARLPPPATSPTYVEWNGSNVRPPSITRSWPMGGGFVARGRRGSRHAAASVRGRGGEEEEEERGRRRRRRPREKMSASLVRATVRAVSKRKLQASRAALTLTPSAVNKIKQLLKDKPENVGVKVGVRTRGCNGLSYTLEYTKTKGDSDEEVVQDGIRVFIEKKAQLTLLGTEMDYVEDKLSSEFVFNNPNIKGTCSRPL
uniref:Iron-sulfur cluster assembly 1 homolog, mitochondrial n=1 Tax=Ornithorhynchus anatinus TaxID=9258 RepID=A0A6I8PHI7_ORNAN